MLSNLLLLKTDIEKNNIKQGRTMSCIKVCPNAYECATLFLKENVHTIGRAIYRVWDLGGSLMSQFLVS